MIWTFFVLTCIISTVYGVDDEFKRKCEENGHSELSNINIEAYLQHCRSMTTDIHSTTDFGSTSPFDNIDEVLKTACSTTIEKTVKCIREMIEMIKPCFSAEEQKSLNTISKIIDELREFICYNDGHRIKEFVTEGGLQCLADKEEAFGTCNLNSLDLEMMECNQLTKLQSCVASVFETCKKPKLTFFINSLFNVVKGAIPCNNAVTEATHSWKRPNSASSFAVTTGTVLIALTAAILV